VVLIWSGAMHLPTMTQIACIACGACTYNRLLGRYRHGRDDPHTAHIKQHTSPSNTLSPPSPAACVTAAPHSLTHQVHVLLLHPCQPCRPGGSPCSLA
jgi:hypothetical protein